MALTEQTVISAIAILEDGQMQIRRARRIFDGSEHLAERYHRYVLVPGQDVSQESPRVRAIANLLWTPAVIATFQQDQAARAAR